VAAAFERYENARVLLGYYREQILPDLVRVYTDIFKRYNVGGDNAPVFADVVVAQQNLAAAVATYITTLGNVWEAVVEVAGPLQTDDLFCFKDPLLDVPAIPDLEGIPMLPCCHPCSPLPGVHQSVANRIWPPTDPVNPPSRHPLASLIPLKGQKPPKLGEKDKSATEDDLLPPPLPLPPSKP
jgi:hypothetical protein